MQKIAKVKIFGNVDNVGSMVGPVLINGVHGHEFEQHEVEDGGDDGEPEEDEEESEENVEGVRLQGLVLLEGNQIAKTWGDLHIFPATLFICGL